MTGSTFSVVFAELAHVSVKHGLEECCEAAVQRQYLCVSHRFSYVLNGR